MKRETGRAGSWPITTGKMVQFYQNLVCNILKRIRSTATSCNRPFLSSLTPVPLPSFVRKTLFCSPLVAQHTQAHGVILILVEPIFLPSVPQTSILQGLEWGQEQRNKNHMAWVLPSIPLRKLGQILSNSLGLSLPVAKLISRQNHISFHF